MCEALTSTTPSRRAPTFLPVRFFFGYGLCVLAKAALPEAKLMLRVDLSVREFGTSRAMDTHLRRSEAWTKLLVV
jgi:hypothetical protein